MRRFTEVALLLALAGYVSGCSSSPSSDHGDGSIWHGNDASPSDATTDGDDASEEDAASDAGADADGGGARAALRWKENGVPRTATSAVANRFVGATNESLGLLGADADAGATLSLIVSSGAGSTLGGTYTCGTTFDGGAPATTAISYDNAAVPAEETCTITVTFAPGADGEPHVTGTFEATLPSGSGTITLTDGAFDLPFTQFGG